VTKPGTSGDSPEGDSTSKRARSQS
jgi:hypothetical protein